jgi:nicotinate-nucleotide adenylyltransferase
VSKPAGERIGIFGGTFDPVHVGHLVAAVNTRHDLGLDRVVLMVANVPWQKSAARRVTPAEDRYAMAAAAVGDVPGVEASRMEIDRGGPSYTADTVAELAQLHPGAELYVIVGWDVSSSLETWERFGEVRALASLVVVNRPGTRPPAGLSQQGWRVREVSVPNLDISSTDLRARAAQGRPLDYLVPQAAVRVIRERGLYSVHR